jgi:hypothetical protein
MTENKFFIVTGGYTVSWAPRFDTRREAELWMNEDHGWEERTEVEFEGDSAHHTCSKCGARALVDDLSGENDFSPVWLCAECQ